MSRSNSICVATVVLRAGILPMGEPETHLMLEAPGGVIAVTAECRNGKAERVSIQNAPSFADRLDAPLEVAGLGWLKVDIAYRGDGFVIVDAAGLGFIILPTRRAQLGRDRRPHHRRSQRAVRFLPSRGQRLNHIPSVSLQGPSRGRETNWKVRTQWSSDPARLTAPRPGPAAAPAWRAAL